MKILKNLGHLITEVKDVNEKGYTVVYGDGDMCDEIFQKRYETEVQYVCNN